MNYSILKKLMLLIPFVILTGTLFFIDYTIQYMKETAYTFVYNTNVGSVQRFSKELEELSSEKYDLQDNVELFTNMIHVYNKTLGEKDAVITFLLSESGQIIHSNDFNKNYLTHLLDNENNTFRINQVAASYRSGEINLLSKEHHRQAETFYYQHLTNGKEHYYIFMGINRQPVEAELYVHAITIPISIISLLLLVVSEGLIWQKMFCIPYDRKKESEKEG